MIHWSLIQQHSASGLPHSQQDSGQWCLTFCLTSYPLSWSALWHEANKTCGDSMPSTTVRLLSNQQHPHYQWTSWQKWSTCYSTKLQQLPAYTVIRVPQGARHPLCQSSLASSLPWLPLESRAAGQSASASTYHCQSGQGNRLSVLMHNPVCQGRKLNWYFSLLTIWFPKRHYAWCSFHSLQILYLKRLPWVPWRCYRFLHPADRSSSSAKEQFEKQALEFNCWLEILALPLASWVMWATTNALCSFCPHL